MYSMRQRQEDPCEAPLWSRCGLHRKKLQVRQGCVVSLCLKIKQTNTQNKIALLLPFNKLIVSLVSWKYHFLILSRSKFSLLLYSLSNLVISLDIELTLSFLCLVSYLEQGEITIISWLGGQKKPSLLSFLTTVVPLKITISSVSLNTWSVTTAVLCQLHNNLVSPPFSSFPLHDGILPVFIQEQQTVLLSARPPC